MNNMIGIISVVSGSLKGMKIPIKNGETIFLGKDPKFSNLVFGNDYVNVSRVHCSITYDSDINAFYVVDLSTNGTYLSNKRLPKKTRTLVYVGTTINLANVDCQISLTVQNEAVGDCVNDIIEESCTDTTECDNDIQNKKPRFFIPVISAVAGFVLIVSVVIAVAINGSTPHIADHGNPLEQNVDLFPEQELMPSNLNKTIMVYLVASDLESQSGAASLDIIEMLESDVDTEKNNILIYTGGTKQWQIENISSTENCIYKLENGSLVLQESYKSSNMGSSETLSRFLKYGMTNFSADKYGLILWNHGAGPMIGCGVDEVYNDILEIPELASALSEAGLGENNKLEFLGFDACLMGSIETAWEHKRLC